MKHILTLFTGLLLVATIFTNCSKNSGYTTTDHTVGMIASRTWSGTDSGYYQGDTTIDTATKVWALYFNRVIADTALAVQKINGFFISFMGQYMSYISTDSATTHSVYFDSITTGTLTAKMYYYYLQDSMTFLLTQVTGFNSNANQYYQTNMFLHTNPE